MSLLAHWLVACRKRTDFALFECGARPKTRNISLSAARVPNTCYITPEETFTQVKVRTGRFYSCQSHRSTDSLIFPAHLHKTFRLNNNNLT